jgi:hypothetical protein
MILKVDFNQFLDNKGDKVELTEQANTVFNFLSKIVLAVSQETVSQDIDQPLIDVALKCKTRGNALSCAGNIEACYASDDSLIIEWQCDTCEAAGTIANWSRSFWDMRERTLH